jgi:ABC-2 type transport system ATP-binding protein
MSRPFPATPTIAATIAADAPLAVATRALTKRYGRETALDGVDLRVPEGAVYVLIGANGAGKSTTFKLLLNLERPDAGSAAVFGLDTGDRGPEVRAQVGYVSERHDLAYRWMTGARLLAHAAAYYPAWDHAYAERLGRALDVRLDRTLGGLSKGEARRLQLVLALAHRPPLLLLDEPTDGLDPVVRRRVLALLAEHLADAPTTVLLATHHVHEVESLADHVGVLRAGRLLAQLPRVELQRTVRRYRVELPAGWEAPPELHAMGGARARPGREAQWTLVGDEREVTARLTDSGALVHEVTALRLEDAALALLPEEGS